MANFQEITNAQVGSKSPVNALLMNGNTATITGGVKFNFDALSDRVIALEASGGGGGGGAEDAGNIGEIIQGGQTNEPVYWKRRFHPTQQMLNADSSNPTGFDPEGKSLKNELLQFIQSNDSGITRGTDSTNYLGEYLIIQKGSGISFKIKKGINFFSVASFLSSGSDTMEVTIDGQTPTSLGLINENGAPTGDSYTEVSATNFSQATTFFYGLDGEEHTIKILNNDSGTQISRTNFIEVGHRSSDPTIDESIHINAGKAIVRGSEATFSDSEFSFGKTELNGHTGAIVSDTSGVLTALDGESPAMTQAKPEESVAFSSAVTSLKVKNNFYFPDSGICLLSTPYGNHHLFSYNAKTDTTIQTHSLDGLQWQSQPTEDFIPCDGFDGAAGEATGDLNINYWGTAPIIITTSNNKLDFKLTIAGVTTTHVATIPSGAYSADLVPIEAAVRTAMQAAKAISGEYHLKYNAESQLWNIYVADDEVENFECLFATGANLGNTINVTLGFAATDFTGDVSYLGTTELQHLCCKVLERDSVFMHSEDPRIKYSTTHTTITDVDILDLQERLNLGSIRNLDAVSLIQIFPEDDCSGLEVSFANHIDGSVVTYQIDDGPCMYLMQRDTTIAASSVRGRIVSSFICFPRGSRKITMRNESAGVFKIGATSNQIYFIGARQYFTKPAYEKLTLTQAVIKTFEVSPISLYATIYGHNGGALYSPAASDDSINTITESGSWFGETPTSVFNRGQRRTNTTNDYIDINFTLVGDGGGVFLKHLLGSTRTKKFGLFISTTAINESTDRVLTTHCDWPTTYYDQEGTGMLGLSAGTYNARFKVEASTEFNTQGIIIVDTVAPQENANTITDINNTGQGVAYPINVIREVIQQDSADRVPSWLERSGYKEGRVSKVNYSLNSPTTGNIDDSSALITTADQYYGNILSENVSGASFQLVGFFKAVSILEGTFTSQTTTLQPFIDGIQTLNNYSQRNQVKGGSSPSSTRSSHSNLTQKLFALSCAHSAGLVFTLNDTKGFKNDATIILDDGVNKEKAQLASFVVGTSFTIKKALTTVIAANVTSIEFQGFHNYLLKLNDTASASVSCFEYEPLKITPSKAIQRRSTEMVYEKVSVTFDAVANGDDLYYPVHSDGVVGNWTTSTISLLNQGADTAFDFPQDLKNIALVGSTIKVKITSERLVPVLNEQERF